MSARPFYAAGILAALALGAPSAARANGRYPTPIDLHFKPGDHQTMALAVTWGLLVTHDEGGTWAWACEFAVGFGGVYDPDYAFTSTGLMLATTTSADGLRLTRDFCTWSPAPPPLGSTTAGVPSTFVSQVEVSIDGTIYVAASTNDNSQIYVSSDDGASFAAVSDPGGGVDWWESLTVSPVALPGGDKRLYLTGYNLLAGGVKERLLFRSDDGAATWIPLPVSDFSFGGDSSDLQIAAVSRDDADVVFARVYQANGVTVGDAIYRSADAGATWLKVFEATDDIPIVMVRNNGDVVVATRLAVASEPSSGVRVSTDGGQTFGAPTLGKTVYCLRERDDDRLYSCADSFEPELMALGTGTTLGDYTPMVTFAEVDDVIRCGAGTTQHDACEPLWCGVTRQFGIPTPQECVLVDAGPGIDGGLVDPPKGGCTDCSTGEPGGMAMLAVLLLVPAVRRRRRKSC